MHDKLMVLQNRNELCIAAKASKRSDNTRNMSKSQQCIAGGSFNSFWATFFSWRMHGRGVHLHSTVRMRRRR